MLLGARDRTRTLDLVGLLARLVLGGVVLVAGLLKVAEPAQSALAVRAYQLLPYDVAGYVGYALPVLEIVVGVLLLAGLFTRTAAVVGALLMVAFEIGIIAAWARGLSIDCGCFGGGGTIANAQTHYVQEVLRDAGLFACGAFLAVRPHTAFGLDQRLNG